MKWILLLAFIALCPVMMSQLRQKPRYMKWAAFAFGLLPFELAMWHLYIAPYGWPGWPGHTKGFELSILDFLAVAVIVVTRGRGPSAKSVWPWLFYAFGIAIAMPHSGAMTASNFYLWQVLRMSLIFVATVRLSAYPRTGEYLLFGVFIGVISQVYYVGQQMLQGVPQAFGAFGSQNLLGLITHLAFVTSLGFLLVGKHVKFALPTLAAAVFVDLQTASRATLGFAAVGSVIMILFSCTKQFTGRKGGVVVAALVAGALLTPLAYGSLGKRTTKNAVASSNAERDAFKRASWMIINDYPLGTGANEYVIVSNIQGYAQRAGVNWNSGSRGTNVHDSYLLVLAETSVVGLLGMIAVLFAPVLRAIRGAFRYRRDPRSDVVLAMGVAMLAVAVHLWFEWAFVLFTVQYMLAAFGGMSSGLVAQMAADARVRSRKKVAEVTASRAAPDPEPALA